MQEIAGACSYSLSSAIDSLRANLGALVESQVAAASAENPRGHARCGRRSGAGALLLQLSQAEEAMMQQVLRARFEQVAMDLQEQKTERSPERGRSSSKV